MSMYEHIVNNTLLALQKVWSGGRVVQARGKFMFLNELYFCS